MKGISYVDMLIIVAITGFLTAIILPNFMSHIPSEPEILTREEQSEMPIDGV